MLLSCYLCIDQSPCTLCQVQSETVQLHLMAALQSLHREGELLPSTQREVLAVMLREHGATAAPHAHATDASLSHGRRSFRMGASSDGGGVASHLMASSQTPPGIPRHSTNTPSRPSELGPAISGMNSFVWLSICNFMQYLCMV